MTEQVNVTDNSESAVSESDYDTEWAKEDENSSSSPSEVEVIQDAPPAIVDEKAAKPETAKGEAEPGTQQDVSPETLEESSAESETSGDIWANAPAELKDAYEKAQNDFRAMKGRHKNAEHRAAALQKEFDKVNGQFAEVTRKKGVYETEHPELFNEVKEMMESRLPQAESAETDQEPSEDLQVVFKVHPDASNILNSTEWETYKSAFTVEQQNKFDSPDPYEFIDLMNEFKQEQKIAQVKASYTDESDRRKAVLEEASSAEGKASKPSSIKNNLSVSEAYEAEWAREDQSYTSTLEGDLNGKCLW